MCRETVLTYQPKKSGKEAAAESPDKDKQLAGPDDPNTTLTEKRPVKT